MIGMSNKVCIRKLIVFFGGLRTSRFWIKQTSLPLYFNF